jgi:hypothetical protein
MHHHETWFHDSARNASPSRTHVVLLLTLAFLGGCGGGGNGGGDAGPVAAHGSGPTLVLPPEIDSGAPRGT